MLVTTNVMSHVKTLILMMKMSYFKHSKKILIVSKYFDLRLQEYFSDAMAPVFGGISY